MLEYLWDHTNKHTHKHSNHSISFGVFSRFWSHFSCSRDECQPASSGYIGQAGTLGCFFSVAVPHEYHWEEGKKRCGLFICLCHSWKYHLHPGAFLARFKNKWVDVSGRWMPNPKPAPTCTTTKRNKKKSCYTWLFYISKFVCFF